MVLGMDQCYLVQNVEEVLLPVLLVVLAVVLMASVTVSSMSVCVRVTNRTIHTAVTQAASK